MAASVIAWSGKIFPHSPNRCLVVLGVGRREWQQLRFGEHWEGVEVERGERLAGGQTRLGEMPFDAATATVGPLVLGERRKEAGRRPAFLVGLLRQLGPHQLEGRQAQLAQQQLDAGGINGVGRRHAPTSRLEVGLTAWTATSSS